MWSPNTTTTKSSDNKQKEEVDDCRCSDAGAGGGGGDQATQQQLNIFDNNSKKPSSTFGGNLPPTSTQKQLAQAVESGDSGFISGPQSSIIDEEEPKADNASGSSSHSSASQQQQQQKFNIAPGAAPATRKELLEEEKTVLDSGCIDEDESFAEDEAAYDDDVSHEATAAHKRIGATATSAEQFKQQHSKSAVGSTACATAPHAAAPLNTQQMILKQNVDAGMSEWFCHLSLQTEAAPRPQTQTQSQVPEQQPQEQAVAGISMNNLAAAGRKAATNISSSNLTPSNAWEQFYQQNDEGDTPLHLACISGFVDVVAALIRMAPHPCLFNIQNDEAQTPLHLAALTAQPKILRMLLIAGAEPILRDRHGNTALHLACISGEEQCVRALTIPISASEIHEAHRQYGHRSNDKTVSYLSCARLPSDLETRNYDGERCVHLAAQSGHIDILRILVLYGADINAREGKSGRTPLHIAIECCNEDLANFLLDECQKLNLEAATYAGLTAYQVACILNKSQMQNILEKRGAEPLTPPDSDYDSSDVESDLEDTKSYDRFGDPGYFANYKGGNPMTVA